MKDTIIIILLVIIILFIAFMFYRMEKHIIKKDNKVDAFLSFIQNPQSTNFVDAFNQLTS